VIRAIDTLRNSRRSRTRAPYPASAIAGGFRRTAAARGRRKSPRQPQTADDGAPVGFLREVARVDRRRVAGPVRLGLDLAARGGPLLPGAGAEARYLLELPIWPPLKLPGAKVHCTSGVADFSNTLTEAAMIDEL
jgi:hypothetical protein